MTCSNFNGQNITYFFYRFNLQLAHFLKLSTCLKTNWYLWQNIFIEHLKLAAFIYKIVLQYWHYDTQKSIIVEMNKYFGATTKYLKELPELVHMSDHDMQNMTDDKQFFFFSLFI